MSAPIVVFDLDGTLVDSAPDLLDSLNFALQREGLKTFTPNDVKRLVGMGGRIMIERALAFQKVPAEESLINQLLEHFLKNYEEEMPGKTRFFNGVDKALDQLSAAGYLLAVCTNKYENLARHLLETLGEEKRFSAICGGDTFAWRKPDGRAILSTIERAGGDFSRSIMIGDSRADILAAQNIDMPVIAVDFGYTEQPVSAFAPTEIISHFSELTPEKVLSLISLA